MFDREKFLKNAKNEEDRLFLSKAVDRILLTQKKGCTTYLGFLDARQQNMLETLLKDREVHFCLFGGYDGAERKMAAFFEWKPEEYEYPITVLEAKTKEMLQLSHRDFLGSLMGLGIKREKIGDILISETAQLIVCEDIAEYIRMNWNKVGNKGIQVDYLQGSLQIPKKQEKMIRDTVSSLRLDSVCCVAFKISRTEAAKLIKQERVCVNYEMISDVDFMLKGGESISAKGFGKAIFDEVAGTSRKGRLVIVIRKLI